MELLQRAAGGLDLLHVPYRGSGPAATALLGGDIAMMFDGAPSAIQQIRGGSLKALGVSTAARVAALPDVPSLAEAGLPGFDVPSWYAMFGPAAMPEPIQRRWRTELAALCRDPAFSAVLERNAATYMGLEDAAMEPFLVQERGQWREAVQASGAKVE